MATAERSLPLPEYRQTLVRMRTAIKGIAQRSSALVEHAPTWLLSRSMQYVCDLAAGCAALYCAYALRFDGQIPPAHARVMWFWMIILPVVRVASLQALGCYQAIWRYFSLNDAALMIMASLPATFLLAAERYILNRPNSLTTLPISVTVLELSTFLGLAGGVRVFRRLTFEAGLRSGVSRRRTLLVGSPDSLAGTLRQVSVYPDVEVAGLISPDRKAHGMRIGGFTVMDEPAALPEILTRHAIDLVLIADASLESLGAMVATATEFGTDVRLMPSAANIMRGDVRVSVLPKADESVLDRAAVTAAEPHPAVVEAFQKRTVLVTGAGGSIGSELCRQIMALGISKLVLFDHDENSIFEINSELCAREGSAGVVAMVGDIRDRDRLRGVFEAHKPHIVLHAAAYKHVPVMESNCSEAVLNNVFGTREVLEAAFDFDAERFLMISTDKAVHPTSIMGATKRLAELLVQQRGKENPNTLCACVRFGNVVGSRGSVVPIFLRQIAAGGPITITDEEMTRYFMTIPEAVQLVIQATTLGSKGDVYMLDMGNPLKIMDLARRLIIMSGLRPGKDIEVRIVGARPGEKIHEQLWYEDAPVSETEFPRILSVESSGDCVTMDGELGELEQAALQYADHSVRSILQQLPLQFQTPQQQKAVAG